LPIDWAIAKAIARLPVDYSITRFSNYPITLLTMRLIAPIALSAAVVFQTVPDGWSRVAALYHRRVQATGIVGSSLMVVKDGRVVHRRHLCRAHHRAVAGRLVRELVQPERRR
jgi:hypothetical protein